VTPVPRRSPHRFLGLYGASPLHLVGQLACFAVAGYAAVQLLGARPAAVLLWFVGAAVLNDILLAPLYILLDRSGRRRRGFPPWWNHVRVPAAISLLLLLVWFPELARRSHSYTRLTGLDASVYLGRWLAVSGVLFALSALALGVGRLRAARRRPAAGSGGDPATDVGDPGARSAE
jgi:hypothetical protein